jgi:hypothetical protein
MREAKVDAEGNDEEEDEVRLGKVLDFMRLLWSVDHGLQSLSKRMDARLGVTGPQRLVIRIVGRFPGISPGEIADILKVHKSTLTVQLRDPPILGVHLRLAPGLTPREAFAAKLRLFPWGGRLSTEAPLALAETSGAAGADSELRARR